MKQLQQIFDTADLLYSLAEIDHALEQLASKVTAQFENLNPVILCVMKGSVVVTGQLLPKLHFPLEIDYIHASRYANKTVGSELHWIHKPEIDLADRNIILVEDIFDEGITLHALREYCEQANAKTVSCVTLIDKLHNNKTGGSPEFIGLTVPNRYVFGFGMDYKGYWRNAPGIYAVKDKYL